MDVCRSQKTLCMCDCFSVCTCVYMRGVGGLRCTWVHAEARKLFVIVDCFLYAHVCVCGGGVKVHMGACRGQRSTSGILYYFFTLDFESGSLTEFGAHWLARQTEWQTPGIHLCPLQAAADLRFTPPYLTFMWVLGIQAQVLNACISNTLSTEHLPSSREMYS